MNQSVLAVGAPGESKTRPTLDNDPEKSIDTRIKQTSCEHLHELPREIVHGIVDYLKSVKDITNFELACRSHEKYTAPFWEARVKRYYFKPMLSVVHLRNSRDSFLFAKLIFSLGIQLLYRENPLGKAINFDAAQRIKSKLDWVRQRFSQLNILLHYILYQKSVPEAKNVYYKHVKEILREIFEQALAGEPTSLTLQGILEPMPANGLTHLVMAARAEPNVVTLILGMNFQRSALEPGFIHLKNNCLFWAVSEAEKGHFRLLGKVLVKWPDLLGELVQKGKLYPPVLFHQGIKSVENQNYPQAELEFDKAIREYGSDITFNILLHVAAFKRKSLNKPEEALPIIERALRVAESEVLPKMDRIVLFAEAAYIHFWLKDFKKADEFFEKIFVMCGNQPALPYYEQRAFALKNLGRFSEANALLKQASKIMKSRNLSPSIPFLFLKAEVKTGLKKYHKADVLYNKYFELSSSTQPATLVNPVHWIFAGRIKIKIGQEEVADQYFTKGLRDLEAQSGSVAPYFYQEAAELKLSLNQPDEAYGLYQKEKAAHESSGSDVPERLLDDLERLDKKLPNPLPPEEQISS